MTDKKPAVKTVTVEVPKHTNVALVAAVNNGVQIGRYSKLFAVIAGNILAIFLAWLAFQFPAISQCTFGPEGTQACTVMGVTQAQILGALMSVISSYFVYQSPANDPPA